VAPKKPPTNKRENIVPNLNRAFKSLTKVLIAPLKIIPANRQIPKKYRGT